MEPRVSNWIDVAIGALGVMPDTASIRPGLTLGEFASSDLGVRAERVDTDKGLETSSGIATLRLELRQEEWLDAPTALTLDFFEGRLERTRVQILEPPIPLNPRWRRREDEVERDRRHGIWLAAARATPGWYTWGELTSGYNSAVEASSIRLRYTSSGRPWPLAGRVIPAKSRPNPSEAFHAATGELRLGSEATKLSGEMREHDFRATTLGRRARSTSAGMYRLDLAPGELFEDAGLLLLEFDASSLRQLRFAPVSERFGVDWNDHGPEEADAVDRILREWLSAATGAEELTAEWGQATVHRDRLGGSQEVQVTFLDRDGGLNRPAQGEP